MRFPSSSVAGLSVATALLLAGHLPAATSPEYDRLLECRFAGPITIDQPIEWRLDTAEWRLHRGRLWLMEPIALAGGDALVTGLVFEGEGTFSMTVPDPVERRQLARFADDAEVDRFGERFDRLVLRGTMLERLLPLAALEAQLDEPHTYAENKLARERMANRRRFEFADPDALTLQALMNPGDELLEADMRTERFDWIGYSYDTGSGEEVTVSHVNSGRGFSESWLSLDRTEDRREDGRPGSGDEPALRLLDFVAKVDVTKAGKGGTQGVGAVNPVDGRFETTVRFEALRELGAARLELYPLAEVVRVWNASNGRELPFLRYAIGRTNSSLPNRLHHSSLVVLLDQPLAQGAQLELGFEYRLELPGYASALSWYPRPAGMGLDLHRMRLEVTHRSDYAVKAVGRQVEQHETDGGVLTVWETERPMDAAGFTIARSAYERDYTYEGLPEVTMFGTQAGGLSAEKIDSFAPDIINSLNYFQQLFASPVRTPGLIVSFIASGHGQAMEGFLHISDAIAQAAGQGRATAGTREAFLAHEVAHEWWGHQVGWRSYRDQWLSEGFAEYSAMMFVEASLDNGPKIFDQILAAYTDELTGSIKSAFGPFSRPGAALLNDAGRDRMGPIGLGTRAVVAEAPNAYQSMAYTKGALVLHMLRSILRVATKSDETFVAVLRDFVAAHRGGRASTADFQEILTKHFPADWSWFFDQWVEATWIPTYSAKSTVERGDGGKWLVRLDVTQDDVPAGFSTPVPVRIDLGGGKVGEMLVVVDEPREAFTIPVPAKPKKVIFNPDHAILAKMR